MEYKGQYDFEINSNIIITHLEAPSNAKYIRFVFMKMNNQDFAKILYLDEGKNVIDEPNLIVSKEEKIEEIEKIYEVYQRQLK